MDAITLDQMHVFATVAEEGSFSAAARRLGRAQSALTYSVQKLEEQVGSELFDRSGYRPKLSEAGRALLPRARRVIEDVAAFGAAARGIAGGLEPELPLVVDSMFPMCDLVAALAELQQRFPSVVTRLHVESLGAAPQLVIDGKAALGVVLDFAAAPLATLTTATVGCIQLVPVAAPGHPLTKVEAPIAAERLRDHPQLVLSDRSTVTEGRDLGVLATQAWRLGDLGAKHALLLAGLGWGSMPRHVVAGDLAEGRLVPLDIERTHAERAWPVTRMLAARRQDRPPGPAGAWLWDRLTSRSLAHSE